MNYTISTENIANPERGLYHYTEGNSTGSFTALSKTEAISWRTNEKITQVFRLYNLTAFRTKAITSTFLGKITTDLNNARLAGVKLILCFSYGDTSSDATKSRIIGHIDQLKTITIPNQDVIACIQAGFIGAYGEWYYSNNFGTENLTNTQKNNRKAVGNKIMELAPLRPVLFRTPAIMRFMFGTTPVSSATAYNGTNLSRAGFQNDCFLSGEDDYGTYADYGVEYPYLKLHTKYTVSGGETCDLVEQYAECDDAMQVMDDLNWSYLNIDYNEDVINYWSENNCLDTIVKKLGYRFELISSTKNPTSIDISLRNTGFGHLYNERTVYIVFRNATTGAKFSFPINSDPRLWLKNTTINLNLAIPSSLPAGNYQVLLNLPDKKIPTNPIYSVRMANTNVWEEATGMNNLGIVITKN